MHTPQACAQWRSNQADASIAQPVHPRGALPCVVCAACGHKHTSSTTAFQHRHWRPWRPSIICFFRQQHAQLTALQNDIVKHVARKRGIRNKCCRGEHAGDRDGGTKALHCGSGGVGQTELDGGGARWRLFEHAHLQPRA